MTQSPDASLQSPDLYALIIRLTAVQSGTLRATQGHLAHAAFLDILRQVDPELTQSLHDWHGRKPFTLSPLNGFGRGRKGTLRLSAGQEGWLRVTLLDPILFQTFIRYFLLGSVRATIRLGALNFHVSEILSRPESHPQAGHTSLAQLATRWNDVDLTANSYHRIPLRFDSPMAFSIRNTPHRHMVVLPDPFLIFGQLATYWDDLTGAETAATTRAYAADCVVVARHRIQTHMYQYRKSRQVGFTGSVTFELLDKEDQPLVRHLNRLADLAFFTGIGSKTTMGMGQVRRMKNKGGG